MKFLNALKRYQFVLIIAAAVVTAATMITYSFLDQQPKANALHVVVVDAATLSANVRPRLESTLKQRVEDCPDAQVFEFATSLLTPYIDTGYADGADLYELLYRELTKKQCDIAFIGSDLVPIFASRGYLVPLSEEQAAPLGEGTKTTTAGTLPDGTQAIFGAVIDGRPLTPAEDIYYGPKDEKDPKKDIYICAVRLADSKQPELADRAMDYFCNNYR